MSPRRRNAPSLPLWQHKDDPSLGEAAPKRVRYPTPQVFTLHDSAMAVTKQWQFFIRAINHQMPLKKVSAIFGSRRAFCNRKGFGDPDLPPRADYILGENLDRPAPEFDRIRTCGLSVLTGVVDGDFLIVTMLDGTQDPPLKEGRKYPARVKDVDIDDYVYTPRTHRHLFFAANIINREGESVPFPNGAVYDWMGDNRPYTWLPHVSRFEVRYPLSKLTQLPKDSAVPAPYRP